MPTTHSCAATTAEPARAGANGPIATAELSQVPCPYCDGPVPAVSFRFLSSTQRLLASTCPGCAHRVLITARHWRRLGGRLELVRVACPPGG
jgi:DNA-directed RNA polymerase subunit RPC12/RpoP